MPASSWKKINGKFKKKTYDLSLIKCWHSVLTSPTPISMTWSVWYIRQLIRKTDLSQFLVEAFFSFSLWKHWHYNVHRLAETLSPFCHFFRVGAFERLRHGCQRCERDHSIVLLSQVCSISPQPMGARMAEKHQRMAMYNKLLRCLPRFIKSTDGHSSMVTRDTSPGWKHDVSYVLLIQTMGGFPSFPPKRNMSVEGSGSTQSSKSGRPP